METEYKKVKAVMSETGRGGSETRRGEDGGEVTITSDDLLKTAKVIMDADIKREVPDGVTQARQHLMKAANLMLLCMESARYVAKQWEARHEHTQIPNEHFQGICSTFFINATHARMVDRMPARPIK